MEDSEDELHLLLFQKEEEMQDTMSMDEKVIRAGTPLTEMDGDTACILDCRRRQGRGLKKRQKVRPQWSEVGVSGNGTTPVSTA